jgi:hypothetical protein
VKKPENANGPGNFPFSCGERHQTFPRGGGTAGNRRKERLESEGGAGERRLKNKKFGHMEIIIVAGVSI